MSRPNTDPSRLTPAEAGYGSFVICPSCSRQSDIWTEHCACGVELLPDDRKVKLAKSGGTPFARITRRSERLESEGLAAGREQVVRDLAALRATEEGKKHADENYTPRIVRNLIKLDRIDQACQEAETLPSRGSGALPSAGAIETLARECLSRQDPRAERWLRVALDRMGTGKEHLNLQGVLVGLLSEAGRASEALEAFERAVAELDALRKKTSKGALVNLVGPGDSFAVGYWSQATNALDTLRRPVVGASVAAAVLEGEEALAEIQRLDRSGDIAAARDAAGAAVTRLSGAAKRLKPLAAGLSKSEGKAAMDPLEAVVRSLEVELKRLKKLAKRS